MGGGGLDYYDPSMLLRIGSATAPDPKSADKIETAKAALAKARADLNSLSDDPTKSKAGPDREARPPYTYRVRADASNGEGLRVRLMDVRYHPECFSGNTHKQHGPDCESRDAQFDQELQIVIVDIIVAQQWECDLVPHEHRL